MRKSYLFLFLLLIVLFVSGCEQGNNGGGDKAGPFFGGEKGVVLSFVDNSPPSRINQGENVPVKVLLKNEGEYNLRSGDAKVRLFGLTLEHFSLHGNFKPITGNLMGRSENLLDGGEQEISFPDLRYTKDVVNSMTRKLRAKICYPYQTEARIPICIKSETTTEEVCDEKGDKVVRGSVSSAPVQVTSVTEELYGSDRIKFNILIKDAGSGDVHYKDYSCEDIDDEKMGLDEVEIEMEDTEIVCTFRDGTTGNKGKVTLNNKPLVCHKKVEDSYEDVLIARLRYKYIDRIEQEMEIVEV